MIDDALMQAATGRGSAILISGEAGIGKTRLAREALQLAAERGLDHFYGRFHESELNLAYVSLARVLADVAVGPVGPELNRLLAIGGASVPSSAPPGPAADRSDLNREAWECLAGASRARPFILVLDDLQWADASSLSLLEFLLPRLRTVPIVLLLLRRTPSLNSATRSSSGHTFDWHSPHFRRHELVGLRLEDVEELLSKTARQELDDFGVAFARATHRRTAGNPLFVEEIVRHLVQTGKLIRYDAKWQIPSFPTGELELPPGLTEVITDRLALVPEKWRQILTYGAVLGNVFDFDILATMTDTDEEEVILAVEHALRAQLITESPGSPRSDYEFRHEVVRQVLYESLSKPRRQKLHLRAAHAMELAHRGDDSYEAVEQIARHYRLAGRYADPERTLEAAHQAARHADELCAYDEAILHLEFAASVLQQSGRGQERLASLYERLAALYFVTGISPDKGRDYSERAIAIYREMGLGESAARSHTRLVWQYASNRESLDLPRAREELRAAEEVFLQGPDSPAAGYFHIGRAGAALWELRTSEGLLASRKAMDIAEALGDEALWASAASMHGWHVAMSGRVDEGLALCERAWQIADRLNTFVWTFRAAWYRGTMAYLIGDPGDARNWFQRESGRPHMSSALTQRRSLVERLGNAFSTMGNLSEAVKAADELTREGVLDATICFRMGDWERAEALWLEAKEKAVVAGDAFDVWRVNYRLAQLYQMRGQFDLSLAILREALAATSDQAVVLEAHTQAKVVQLLNQMGAAGTPTHLARLEEIVSSGGDWRGLMGHVFLARASDHRARGDHDGDRSDLQHALEVFQRYQNPWECIETLVLLSTYGPDSELLARAQSLAQGLAASGYWNKRREFLGSWCDPATTGPLGLSPREVEVLDLVRAGKTNKQIAETLSISHHTVARHVSAILRKANIENRTAAASLFAELSLPR